MHKTLVFGGIGKVYSYQKSDGQNYIFHGWVRIVATLGLVIDKMNYFDGSKVAQPRPTKNLLLTEQRF
ncbi:MAG: hypothetical protein EAZ32_06470 [Cytophagia bacterium]|nr:MAG: hypothetical protein EAZ38_01045 [Cytophagales bacterium]TAG40510.1 MAG: hypothetical protein EAZ32_06470 [Cytophagia bacterium]TAG56847.1 MAG: hypothetical protein EAZ29_02660 [Runella slithyformis]TAG77497.1 MAG: hypothetical protein EAZ22_15550 [Cytophagales bacterium]